MLSRRAEGLKGRGGQQNEGEKKASALGLLSIASVMGRRGNLAQNQPLMPLKCQRLQKGRETAERKAHSYFSKTAAIMHARLSLSAHEDTRRDEKRGKHT